MRGFERDYRFTLWFAAVALLPSAFLPGWPLGWRGGRSLKEQEEESAERKAA